MKRGLKKHVTKSASIKAMFAVFNGLNPTTEGITELEAIKILHVLGYLQKSHMNRLS